MNLVCSVKEDDNLFSLDEFREGCLNGLFIDDDGTGYYSNGVEYQTEQSAQPGSICRGEHAPTWATHVVWFNN